MITQSNHYNLQTITTSRITNLNLIPEQEYQNLTQVQYDPFQDRTIESPFRDANSENQSGNSTKFEKQNIAISKVKRVILLN